MNDKIGRSSFPPLFLQLFFLLQFIGNTSQSPKIAVGKNRPESGAFGNFDRSSGGINESNLAQNYADLFFGIKPENGWRISAYILDEVIANVLIVRGNKQQPPTQSAAPSHGKRNKGGQKGGKGKKGGGGGGESSGTGPIGDKVIEEIPMDTEVLADFEQKLREYKIKKQTMEKLSGAAFGSEQFEQTFSAIFACKAVEKCILSYFNKEAAKTADDEIGSIWRSTDDIGKKLHALTARLHTNTLLGLLEKKPIKNKLVQELEKLNSDDGKISEVEKEKKFELVKGRMRMLLDEHMFLKLEMMHPILLRIDIIEWPEWLRIYKQILSHPSGAKPTLASLVRLCIATIFGKIWNLRKEKMNVKKRFEQFWNDQFFGKKKTKAIQDAMYDFWLGLLGIYHKEDPRWAGHHEELKDANVEQLVKLYYGKTQEFRAFLNATKGVRGRIVEMFEYGSQIEEILTKGEHKLTPLLRIEPTEEEMMDSIYSFYLEAFTDEEISRKQSVFRINILLKVPFLDNFFDQSTDELAEEWRKYRPIFFLHLDQLADGHDAYYDTIAILYRNMLFILRKYAHSNPLKAYGGQLKIERIRDMIGVGLDMVQDKGTHKSIAFSLIDAQEQEETFGEDNFKMLEKLRKIPKYHKLNELLDAMGFEKEVNSAEIAQFLVDGKAYKILISYKKFLGGKEIMETIDVDAVLWHYTMLITALFDAVTKEIAKSRKEYFHFDSLKKQWEIMKNLEDHEKLGKHRKLCKMHLFVQCIYEKIDEDLENEPKMLLYFQLSELAKIARNVISYGACEDEHLADIVPLLIRLQALKRIHLDYLTWLINNFADFQQFLLDVDGDFKGRILKLIDHPKEFKQLEKLEKMHPKWLRIGEMQLDMRLDLYKKLLTGKSFEVESKNAERRLAAALFVDQLKRIEKAVIYKEIQKKRIWVEKKIYAEKWENFDSLQNICVMMRFVQMANPRKVIQVEENISQPTIAYELAPLANEEDFQNYTGDYCKHKEEQENAWVEQRMLLKPIHYNFLTSEDAGDILATISRQFGGLARLRMLIPEANFNKDIKIDTNFFLDNSRLCDHIIGALFDMNKETLHAHKVAVNFFSWVRFFEKELEEGKKEIEKDAENLTSPGILYQIWKEKEIQRRLIVKYDAFFDKTMEQLVEMDVALTKMQFGLKDYIEKQMKTPKETFSNQNIGFGWKLGAQQNFVEIIEGRCGELDGEWSEMENEEMIRRLKEYDRWISGLNRDNFLEQFSIKNVDEREKKRRREFRKTLKLNFKKEEGRKNRLPFLVGYEGNGIQKILENLDMEFNPDEFNHLKKDVQNIGEKSEIMEGHFTKGEASTSSTAELPGDSREEAEKSAIGEAQKDHNEGTTEMIEDENKRSEEEKLEQEVVDEMHSDKARTPIEKSTVENIHNLANINVTEKKKEEEEGKGGIIQVDSSDGDRTSISSPHKELKVTLGETSKIAGIGAQSKAKKRNEKMVIDELLEMLQQQKYGGINMNINQQEKSYMIQSGKAIEEIRHLILHEWNSSAKLLISGSYKLKLYSADSDIDLIIILPYDDQTGQHWKEEFEKYLTGNSQSKCIKKKKKCENDDKISLYCLLCKEKRTRSLKKIPGRVPLIKMRYRGVDFDINMVLLPKQILADHQFPMEEEMGKEKDTDLTVEQIDEIIKNFVNIIGVKALSKDKQPWEDKYTETDDREGMVLTLSGYRANKQLEVLLSKSRKFKMFQIVMMALKLWAKNHFIYGGQFGFFNGTTLAIMVCKLVTTIHAASTFHIIEQFFATYHGYWSEEVRLEVAENYPKIREKLDWTLARETAARNYNDPIWPVITPGFPTQNAAFNINPSTVRIINEEMDSAMENLKSIRNMVEKVEKPSEIEIEKHLKQWLMNDDKFEDKYDHFLAIVCTYPTMKNAPGNEFCGFIETKIRLQLLFSVESIQQAGIDYCQIKPERIFNSVKCPHIKTMNRQNWLCTVWLVGIKLKVETFEAGQKLEATLEDKEGERLKEFANKLKKGFAAPNSTPLMDHPSSLNTAHTDSPQPQILVHSPPREMHIHSPPPRMAVYSPPREMNIHSPHQQMSAHSSPRAISTYSLPQWPILSPPVQFPIQLHPQLSAYQSPQWQIQPPPHQPIHLQPPPMPILFHRQFSMPLSPHLLQYPPQHVPEILLRDEQSWPRQTYQQGATESPGQESGDEFLVFAYYIPSDDLKKWLPSSKGKPVQKKKLKEDKTNQK